MFIKDSVSAAPFLQRIYSITILGSKSLKHLNKLKNNARLKLHTVDGMETVL